VGNVRESVEFMSSGMSAGAPAVENVTVWWICPIDQVTEPPLRMSTVGGS